MKSTINFNEAMLGENMHLVALNDDELMAIDGGHPVAVFVLGVFVGWIGGKVLDGIVDGITRDH